MKKIVKFILLKFQKNRKSSKNKNLPNNNIKNNQTNNLEINTTINPEWIFETIIKKIGIDKQSNNIDTLILGSSHGEYGINPKYMKNTYNLCLPSQDLYYSYNLYKNHQYKNLKNILLFFSVFSPGFDLIKTNEYKWSLLYKKIFKIPYKNKYNKIFSEEEKYAKNQIDNIKKTVLVEEKYSGYNYNQFFLDVHNSIKNRTKTHLRENIRKKNQLTYLYKMQKLAKKNNHNLIIIIPPAKKIYKTNLPNSNILFKNIIDITNKLKIKLYDFYNSEDFLEKDFWDFDHLNSNGSKKLTKMISKNIS